MSRRLRWAVLAIVGLGWSGALGAGDPLATAQLEIRGSRLWIYADELVDDAAQVVNVGEPAVVRTCFGGVDAPCGEVQPNDPRVTGLVVRGELRGPQLPEAMPLETVPGGAFILPSFQQAGMVTLENIRLVRAASDEVLGWCDPPVATVQVAQIAVAYATVSTLSLEDLESRGITLTQENFQAFDFTVGFGIEGEFVELTLPVLYDGNGQVSPLDNPVVDVSGLSAGTQEAVARWRPPSITPFVFEGRSDTVLETAEEDDEALRLPMLGAIVMPGTVSFLNQFFETRLIVANGAPAGSQVGLVDLQGRLRLPSGHVLRLAETDPPVAAGQWLPVTRVSVDGAPVADEQVVPPAANAAASWILEGLIAGTHLVRFEVEGEIRRPGREPFPVATTAQAAVDVVDPGFHLAFTHPDVVREGSEYSLLVTLTNLSRAERNLVTVSIDPASVVGATLLAPASGFADTIQTLAPGASETVEFRFEAGITGRVVAATFETTSDAASGSIRLVTGVGELGIPLSPATLRLPRFSERLAPPYVPDDGFQRAFLRFLGLAYSLGVAPSNLVGDDLPVVQRADVEQRAIDVAAAGQRTFLGEDLLPALEVMTLELLGGSEPLSGMDALRRRLSRGIEAFDEIGALLRWQQAELGLDAEALLDHLASTASYMDGFVAVLWVPDAPGVELRVETVDGVGAAAGRLGGIDVVRTLPFGDVLGVSSVPGAEADSDLVLVGAVWSEDRFRARLVSSASSDLSGRLVLLVPDAAGELRRVDLGRPEVPAGGELVVELGPAEADPEDGGFVLREGVDGPVAGVVGSSQLVPLPPFRLIGARQDYDMGAGSRDLYANVARPNRYGQGLSYLFNRPPDEAIGSHPEHFRIEATFDGVDVTGGSVHRETLKVAEAAFLQSTGRVVNVRYDSPISALLDELTSEPLVSQQHALATADLVDRFGNSLDPVVPPPLIETDPEHRGGLVGGRVLRGDGAPVVGATVQLIRPRYKDGLGGYDVVLDRVAETSTDAEGFYFFDFVEDPHPDPMVLDGFRLRAIVPEGADPATEPAGVEEVGSLIRHWNRMARINIALLGRGSVTGRLVYAGTGEPVPQGVVTASSSLFNEVHSVEVEADGSYEIRGLPVGPITVAGRDRFGRTAWATVGIDGPGDVVVADLEILIVPPPGQGVVQGRVVARPEGQPQGELTPVAGADVAVWSDGVPVAATRTSSAGAFRFEGVTAGSVTVQAASWQVSRTPARTSFQLASSETVELELVLPRGRDHRVVGEVAFLDPTVGGTVPVVGANVFIQGPGVWAQTDEAGRYAIEGVPEQGIDESPYTVTAIDPVRKLQGTSAPFEVTSVSPDELVASQIVLREMRGSIRGVVLDPWGRPASGVQVVAELGGVPYRQVNAFGDGSFHFDDMRLGEWTLTAHRGDGLDTGAVGWIGEAETEVVFGGHQAFASVRLRGAGVVLLDVRTAAGDGVMCPVYYKPTVFSALEKKIRLAAAYTETSTDPTGHLELELPVGSFEIAVYSPFHGIRTVRGQIDWAGQVKELRVAFTAASRVVGTVVDVDGVTPIADIPVTMQAFQLQPQTLRTDELGRFAFELVPEGGVQLRTRGVLDGIERFAAADGVITGGGQELELKLRLKAQGSVRGRILLDDGDTVSPLPGASFYVSEGSHPYRTLPSVGAWYTADANGAFEVGRLAAGPIRVVGWDGQLNGSMGSVSGTITSDWQLVELADLVLRRTSATLEVEVRDPETGAPLADCQVRLERVNASPELSVSDASGVAVYQGLPLGAYSVVVFHAPTGRTGRGGPWSLATPNEVRRVTVTVDSRGRITGTLFDGPGYTNPLGAGVVDLYGTTSRGPLTAVASTLSSGQELGRFSFGGIPEGRFELTAGLLTSPRRASAEVEVTATSPEPDLSLELEPVGDVWARVLWNPSQGVLEEIDPASGVFAVELVQGRAENPSYDVALVAPTMPGPGHLYRFPEVLTSRSGSVIVQELDGERREGRLALSDFEHGSAQTGFGTEADPYRVVLAPKGAVRVTVRDGGDELVSGAGVTLGVGHWSNSSATNAQGVAVFTAVPAGNVAAVASSPVTGFGGRADGVLRYDEDVLDLEIRLAPVVSAHGRVFLPTTDDLWSGDPEDLEPAADVWVTISTPGGQLTARTGADGGYRFQVLATGSYSLRADSADGAAVAAAFGELGGPDGADHELPDLILDASPPRILAISPAPGMRDVSPTAVVEIVFSEALDPAVLPSGATSSRFELGSATGLAVGSWSSAFDADGRQVVRFVPSAPYTTSTIYTLVIHGGPGGVRDLAGRLLTESGDVGSTFTIADVAGPKVLGTEPKLDRPFDPEASLRLDFNEVVSATDGQWDDEAVIEWMQSDGEWNTWILGSFAVTRQGYSLLLNPREDYMLTDDSLLRRVRVERIEDSKGNDIDEPWQLDFRVRDANPPVIDALPAPAGAPTGQLSAGNSYVLTPVLSGIDHFPVDPPAGDLDRVEFFFEDPADVSVAPIFTATTPPWSFPFTATYAGGGEPQPRPVWARATDTSDNLSEVARVDLVVMPNQPPTITSVEVAAASPAAGTPYAGSTLQAAVAGLGDPDGAQVSVSAELRRADGGALLATAPAVAVTRPPSGDWAELQPVVLSLTLPASEPEGSTLLVRVVALDSHGASAMLDSAPLVVADDATPPVVEGIVARHAGSLEPDSSFAIGDSLLVELRARDLETAVDAVEVRFDGILPSPLVAQRVTGDLYRTPAVEVPHSVFDEPVTVTVTAEASDRGGNAAAATLELELAPDVDPTAPTVEWLTPWEGAPWPAAHVSPGGTGGTPFLIRVRVADTALDGEPGEIAAVELRGPVPDGSGGAMLSPDPTAGLVVAGTEVPGGADYQLAWTVPDGLAAGAELPFEVRVVDTGNLERIDRVRMRAVSARRAYERVESSVTTGDPMLATGGDADGAVFLLDGAVLSVAPQTDGSVRALPEVVLYAGADAPASVRATVLTVPRVTSPASSRTFLPLELAVDRLLAVGVAARIDVTGCGVMGGNEDGGIGLDGPVAARQSVGGAHGGRGWFGSPGGGWERTDLTRSHDAYDSLRAPRLAGLGGGGWGANRGGQGGGVIRVDAPDAVVRLVGDVCADGMSGRGGGAGGTIRMIVHLLEGGGRLTARGGDAVDAYRNGGGGGGRVSLRYRETVEHADLAGRVDVSGGLTDSSGVALRGGAGTVYLEAADPVSGEWSGRGQLVIAGPAANAAASTSLPGLSGATVDAVDLGSRAVELAGEPRGDLSGEALVVAGIEPGAEMVLPILEQRTLAVGVELVLEADAAELAELAARVGGSEPVQAWSRTRLAEMRASGVVRADAAGELEVGLTTPVIDDRAAIVLESGGRVRFTAETTSLEVASTPSAGTEIRVGSTVTASWTAADPLGLGWVAQEWSASGATSSQTWSSQPTTAASTPAQATLTVPPTQAPGPVTWNVTVTDLDGRPVQRDQQWTVLPNEPPTGLLRLADGASATVHAGGVASVTVEATDLEGLALVRLDVAGPSASPQYSQALSGLSATHTLNIPVLENAPAGELVITGVVRDSSGAETAIGPLAIVVNADTEPPLPVISLSPVRTDDVYRSGDRLTITASATDDVRVAALELRRDGVLLASSGGTALTSVWTAPPVPEDSSYQLTATATDPSGNSATVTRPITVQPNQNPNAPVVSILCPFDGDGCAVGATSRIRFTLTDTDAIHSWWLLADGIEQGVPVELSANTTSYSGIATWTPPTDAGPGQVIELTLEARDFNLENVGRATIYLTVLEGAVLEGDQSLDLPSTGEHVVLGPGSYTANVDLEPASLTMLAGSRLTTTVLRPLAVQADGPVVLQCDAAIDVSGLGYRSHQTHPDAVLSTSKSSGGSHFGEGGVANATPASTFGSVTRPSEFGGGGHEHQYDWGRPGGGVLRLESGSLHLDGGIRANGLDAQNAYGRGGAGGSIWISTGTVVGTGAIEARGGRASTTYSNGSGGGGAIAVEYVDAVGTILDNVTATTANQTLYGGAGAVFLHRQGEAHGRLVVDNIGRNGMRTVPPSLGQGEAYGGSAGPVLETGAEQVPEFFVGHWVRVTAPEPHAGSPPVVRGTWRIESIDGGTLTLEEGAAVEPGDTWQGVYRFDSVTVRGKAKLWVDDLDEFGDLIVEAGSSVRLRNGEDPTILPDLVYLGQVPGEFRVSGDPGAVMDPDGVASARVVNVGSGASWPVAVAPDGSFAAVTVSGAAGDQLRLEATDAHDAPRSASVVIGSLSANDGPPTFGSGISLVLGAGDEYVVQGGPGSVTDVDLPITLMVVDVSRDAATATVEAASDGAFVISLSALAPYFGDELRLVATDTHPEPATSILPLGAMPDYRSPTLDPLALSIGVHDRAYWVSGTVGAALDENPDWHVDVSWISGEHFVEADTQPDGSFVAGPILWPSSTEIVVNVTDVGNNTVSAPAGALPANDGPPSFDLAEIHSDAPNGLYTLSGDGECDTGPIGVVPVDGADGTKAAGDPLSAIHSPDTLFAASLENRSTPGFGPWTPSSFSGQYCSPNRYYGFDPIQVDGAIGDEIWLVAEDGHPEWLDAEARVWTLPQIAGNPVFALTMDHLEWTGAGYELAAAPGSITGAADPLGLEVRVWRANADDWDEVGSSTESMASGEDVRLGLPPGTQPGDLAVVSATDANGRTTRVRLAVPAAAALAIELSPTSVVVEEAAVDVTLTVRMTRELAGAASVDWQLVPGTAQQHSDWTSLSGLSGRFAFGPTVLERTVTVHIVDDGAPETEESFFLQLSNPIGAPILGPDTATVTIVDNDDQGFREIVRSVRPSTAPTLEHPVSMSISDGVATFGEALPWDVGRGDRMESSVGRLYFDEYLNDRTGWVRRPDGSIPDDVTDATVTWIEPAFTSLAEAVRPLNHDWHGSTPEDLVAGNVTMTILCYRGYDADREPVTVQSWITGPDNALLIRTPRGQDHGFGPQRHQGRWTDNAYRLEAPLTISDASESGLVKVEDLQIMVGGGPDDWVRGVYAWTNGRVEISECLVRLDGIEVGAGSHIGIEAEGDGTTVVRNTMVWDVPTVVGSGESVGIRGYGYGDPSLEVLNSTVIGGQVGIQRWTGVVRVVNTLAAGASQACFEGEFTSDSTHNLATDGSAPNPPEGVTGAVSMRGAISGVDADLHLACGVRDQAVTITSNATTDVDNLFDGEARSGVWPNEANPLWVRLEFASPRAVTGTSVLASNCASHLWSLEVADTVDDLEARTGSWREVVPSRLLENWERAFATVWFDEPVTASVFQLKAVRTCDSNGVLLNEWQLHGLNPACATGVEPALSPAQPVLIDIDGAGRVGMPDIGADQTRTVEIRVERHPQVWYEEEGVARIPVILTDPAPTPVTVRMATYDDSAIAGEDYQPVMGLLRWEPGEIEKVVEVPLMVDGVTDPDEGFWFFLNDPAGAVLRDQWQFFVIGEGARPVRVQFAAPLFEASESEGFLRGEVEIAAPTDVEVMVDVAAFSRTARISQDFVSAFDTAVIPPGATRGVFEIELVQDTEIEPTEEMILQLSWATNAEHGARAYAIGRIRDSSLAPPTVSLGAAAVTVGEAQGAVSVPVQLSEARPSTISVTLTAAGGDAVLGEDYVFVSGPQLDFARGETTAWLELDILDDGLDEVLESLVLTLTSEEALIGEPAGLTVTIYDNEADFTVWESNVELNFNGCQSEVYLSEGFIEGEGEFDVRAEVITDGVSTWYEADHAVRQETDTWVPFDRISTTSTVLVHVAAAGAPPDLAFELGFDVYEPWIDGWDIEPFIVDGFLWMSLSEWTISPLFTDTTVLLRNLTTGVDVVPDDPCEVGDVTVSIPVSGPDDLVVLEACNGDPALGLCTTHQLNPEVP